MFFFECDEGNSVAILEYCNLALIPNVGSIKNDNTNTKTKMTSV